MTRYKKLKGRDLLCLEKTKDAHKLVEETVNKDCSFGGRKETSLSYRVCGKAANVDLLKTNPRPPQ